MKNGKYSKRKGVATKTLVMALAVMLIVGCTIGGTLAWLTAETDSVTNTFTVGEVEITLKESPYDADNDTYVTPAENVTNEYKMLPGETYKKDPVVAVVDGSEDCYLFVKFEEINSPSTYIEYDSTLNTNNGWAQGDGTQIPSNVWYREVGASDTTRSWNLLKDDTITIDADAVTKDTMSSAVQAKLVYTAYAVQKDNISDAATAWSKLSTT